MTLGQHVGDSGSRGSSGSGTSSGGDGGGGSSSSSSRRDGCLNDGGRDLGSSGRGRESLSCGGVGGWGLKSWGKSTSRSLATDSDLDDGVVLRVLDVAEIAVGAANNGNDCRLDVKRNIGGGAEEQLGIGQHEGQDGRGHKAQTGGRDHGHCGRQNSAARRDSQSNFLIQGTKVLAVPRVACGHALDVQRSIEGVIDHDLDWGLARMKELLLFERINNVND